MNILPTIAGLILLFAISASFFFQERVSTKINDKSYRGFMRAERLLRNQSATRRYKLLTPYERISKKEPPQRHKATKKYRSSRDLLPPSEAGRLNLYPLFQQDASELLYEMAANLIHHLYGQRSFFSHLNHLDWNYRLLDALINKGKQLKKVEALMDLFPEDPVLAEIYYQMMQGSNRYDLQGQGVPPFEDFFCCDPKQYAVAFHFAPMILLDVVFGKEGATKIRQKETELFKEKGKDFSLTDTELDLILANNAQWMRQQEELKKWISFSKRKPPKEYARVEDKLTKISLKQKLELQNAP